MSSDINQAREQSESALLGSNSADETDPVVSRRIERGDTSYVLFGFESTFAESLDETLLDEALDDSREARVVAWYLYNGLYGMVTGD
jgi:hypothetical protein